MNSLIKNKYIIKGHLFNNYFECLDMSNNKVLLMEIVWQNFEKAIANLELITKFDHPNIVKVYEYFYMMEKREIQIDGIKLLEKIRTLYVIMQFQSHDLKQFAKKLNNDQVINIQKGLKSTFEYIQQQRNDVSIELKIENIFIDGNLNAKCYPILTQNITNSKEKDLQYIDMVLYQIITGRPIRSEIQFTNFQNGLKIYENIKNQINLIHTKKESKYLCRQLKNQDEQIEPQSSQIKHSGEEEQVSINQIEKQPKQEQEIKEEEDQLHAKKKIKIGRKKIIYKRKETRNLRRKYIKKTSQHNSGQWIKSERVRYYEFLTIEQKNYNKEKLYENKFFEKMSAYIISRSPVQCKNYHNRVQAKTCDFKQILNNALKLIKNSER